RCPASCFASLPKMRRHLPDFWTVSVASSIPSLSLRWFARRVNRRYSHHHFFVGWLSVRGTCVDIVITCQTCYLRKTRPLRRATPVESEGNISDGAEIVRHLRK